MIFFVSIDFYIIIRPHSWHEYIGPYYFEKSPGIKFFPFEENPYLEWFADTTSFLSKKVY
jgi:hypothetical protein